MTKPNPSYLLHKAVMALLILSGHVTLPAYAETPSSLASAPASDPSQTSLSTIEKAIMAKGAHWSARTTPQSALPLAAKRKLTGVLPPKNAHHQKNPAFFTRLTGHHALPAQFDWRNFHGHSYVSPVKDQGQCGSCWAFSVTAALEAKTMISTNQPDSDINLADQIVLSCSQAGDCSGGWPDQADGFLAASGTAAASYYPYTASNGSCAAAGAGWRNNSYKINNWQYVVENAQPSADAIKNAIYWYGPVVATMQVYNDFYYYSSGVYSYTTGDYVGAHAILIVGWDDTQQAFIIKNSWGGDWGENGYFEIGYSELSSLTQLGNQMVLANGDAIAPSMHCNYTLSPVSDTAQASGGTGTIKVSGGSTCAWSAQSNAPWLTIKGSGKGDGAVTYTVAANTSNDARSASITIGNQSMNITQAGASPGVPICTLSATPDTIEQGGSSMLNARCAPAATHYSWSHTDFGPGENSGLVAPSSNTTYSVTASNNAGSGNSASVTISVLHPKPLTPTALLTPSGASRVPHPNYRWNAVANADHYYLYVRTVAGRVILDHDYSAQELGCATGGGACAITPATALTPGDYTWLVLAANRVGYSAWSMEKPFTVQ